MGRMISKVPPIQQQSFTTINEPIKLSKKQIEILTMVCDLVLLASKLDDGKKADKSKGGDKAVSDQVNGIGNYPFME